MRGNFRALHRFAIAASFIACSLAQADPLAVLPEMMTTEAVIAPVQSKHRIRVGNSTIRYTATFSEHLLNDEQGRPQATISATSYVRDAVKVLSQRPVLFLFNGGPGASSSPLHFTAFGPRRFAGVPDANGVRATQDNAETLLEIVDLVFIDPVGTGFSRGRIGGDPSRYWNVEADAQATNELVRHWLQEQGRRESPLYFAGESYGGYRLGEMTKSLGDLNVAGLIFISPMLDASAQSAAPGNDKPFIFDVPTMAAAAWYHQKVDRQALSVEQFFDAAAQFAVGDYAVALFKGNEIAPAERDRIAARLSQFIGLSAETIRAANLRVDSEKFLQTLVPELLVGRLDVRVTGPKPVARAKDRPAAADDPALGLKGANVIRSVSAKDYFARELNVKTARDYLSLTLDVNFRWTWQPDSRQPVFYFTQVPHIATLMSQKPQARILLLGGIFDLATPVLAPRHALAHSGVAPERIVLRSFAAGHSPFDSEETRPQVAGTVRSFLQ